jgi:hypothetical protein
LSDTVKLYFLRIFWERERQFSCTGEIYALAETRGLYVSIKSWNRLRKDCEKGDLGIKVRTQSCKSVKRHGNPT